VVQEDVYDGIPVVELPIRDVDVPDPAHLRRSERYPGAVDIAPEEAIEAAGVGSAGVDRTGSEVA
jgi:hypothetical protein